MSQPQAATPPKGNFLLGSLGALTGGGLGMLGWYLLLKSTSFETIFLAWGVGALTGFSARWLGRGVRLSVGIVAALCALVAILGAQLLPTLTADNKVMNDLVDSVYQMRLAQAQEVAKIQTEQELREYLIHHDAKGEMPSEGMLRDWHAEVLPRLKDFANGKPSKEEFSRDFRQTEDVQGDKMTRLKDSFGFFTFFWLLLGVSTAYKLGAG